MFQERPKGIRNLPRLLMLLGRTRPRNRGGTRGGVSEEDCVKRSLRLLGISACVFGTALVSGCGSTSEDEAKTGPATSIAPTTPAGPINEQLMIDEIAVFQGTKATLVEQGDLKPEAKINAPVIAGRPAFIRVFVKAIAGTRPLVEGELRVKRAGKEDLVLKDGGKRVVPELDESMLEQTLNFSVPAEDMTADATFSVRAGLELDGPDVLSFPLDGSTAPFNAKTASKTLRVKFVPVSYEADEGTSLTPEVDVANLKDTLYKLYPVANVEVTIREPLKWSTPVKSNGPGWDELLTGIMQLRRADKAERDVYYVGVFTPKASIDQFCNQGGCILGVAPGNADERDVNQRVALVLGYKSRSAGSTLAQELAHAMGRMHAPCGVSQAVDDDFPYGSGGIGVWGYDILKKELVDPGNRYRDFMSYCGPTWTSDYTYKGIFDRMDIVSKQQQAIDAGNTGGSTPPGSGGAGAATRTMQSFRITSDGAVHEGPQVDVLDAPSSRDDASATNASDVTIAYEGAGGSVLSASKARVTTISGTNSRLVVAPLAPIGATHARVVAKGAFTTGDVRARPLSPAAMNAIRSLSH